MGAAIYAHHERVFLGQGCGLVDVGLVLIWISAFLSTSPEGQQPPPSLREVEEEEEEMDAFNLEEFAQGNERKLLVAA